MPPLDATAVQHSAFFRFTPIEDPAALADAVRAQARCLGLMGSIVVAAEGISGAVAGAGDALKSFEKELQQSPGLQGMAFKRSHCVQPPFARLKVSVKPEIVALGLPPADPGPPPAAAARPLSDAAAAADVKADDADARADDDDGMLPPQAWRELLHRSDVVVLDNRNHFEYRLGHFSNAVDPGVHNFRDFADYVQQQAPGWIAAGQPVAMYCTGGIRCEKTAPWMRSLGLQVLQLQGGILNYFERLPDAQRDWQGECFVFDKRIAIDTQLHETATTAEQVFDARHPDEAWRLQRARRLQQAGG